jgi:hypothetical protein
VVLAHTTLAAGDPAAFVSSTSDGFRSPEGLRLLLIRLPPRSWTALLRIMLGRADPKHAGTPTGDGVLVRLLGGEPLAALREDPGLAAAIRAADPDRNAKR